MEFAQSSSSKRRKVTRLGIVSMIFALIAGISSTAYAQDASLDGNQHQLISPIEGPRHEHAVLPSCGVPSVKDGNPGTGPSVIYVKLQPGCVIPWHWHTPNERVVMVSGSAKAEMRGMESIMLKQGDFILLSSRQIHQFTAVTPVEYYDFSDAPFDIHYVDETGKEVSYQAALALQQPSAAKPDR